MADIKDTKEVINLLAVFAKVIAAANADGKIDVNDLGLLVTVLPSISPAIDGISNVPSEIKDIDESELKEISLSVAELVGDLSSDKYEFITEELFIAAISLFKVIVKLREEVVVADEVTS